MIRKRPTAKIFVLGLCGALAPCLAFAVIGPFGEPLEQVDTTYLGAGQTPAPAAAAPGWAVQVGAFTEKAAAVMQLDRIAERAPSETSRATRIVTPFKWDNGQILYRARFGGLDAQSARAVCALLNSDIHGEICFVVADEPAKPGKDDVVEATADTPPLRGDMDGTATAQAIAAAPVTDPVKVAVSATPTSILGSANRVNNDELSDMRGGFFTAAGAHFDFGASIQTMLNGQLALLTNLQWTPAGPVIQQLSGLGASIQSQVTADLAKAGIGPVATNIVTNATGNALAAAGNAPATGNDVPGSAVTPPATPVIVAPVTAASVSPVMAGGLSGVQIPGAGGGSTQVFANVGPGQIQNILLNSASNQMIAQNTNVTLTIYNFPSWQQQLIQNAVSSQLAHDILAASGIGGH